MARLIRTDRNGTRYYEGIVKCDRCGGKGGAEAWKFTGFTCYKCGGTGEVMASWKEYTPEYEAKMERRRAAKAEKERAQRQAEVEQLRKPDEEVNRAISQYIGEVGDKIRLAVTLERRVNFKVSAFTGRGTITMSVYIFADEYGNKLVWKTGGYLDAAEGDVLLLSATIKAHSEYNEEKQTELMRVRAERSV